MWQAILQAMGGNFLGGVAEIIKQFNLSPEQSALLQTELARLESATKIAVEQAMADDRASAREREKILKDATPKILAIAVTCGFFGVLLGMLFVDIPVSSHDALLVMLGALGTAWTAVVGYYFGSSAGSEAKTFLLSSKGKSS